MSRIGLGLAAVIAALTLVGCGGGGSGGAEATPSRAPQDQALDYVRCLRRHGVDLPDPGNGQGGDFPKPGGGDPARQAAEAACRDLIPPKMRGGTDPRAHDQLVSIARCMRIRGIEVPDPQPGQQLALPTGDRAQAEQALDACAKASKRTGGGS
ncbi:MAG TPA: hypothetical protein VGP70_16085 [Actinomadura sp.]|jgi:hypothetical protein|nr:hypothetical protein [Actinomadura sp.]